MSFAPTLAEESIICASISNSLGCACGRRQNVPGSPCGSRPVTFGRDRSVGRRQRAAGRALTGVFNSALDAERWTVDLSATTDEALSNHAARAAVNWPRDCREVASEVRGC